MESHLSRNYWAEEPRHVRSASRTAPLSKDFGMYPQAPSSMQRITVVLSVMPDQTTSGQSG
jgi:hypothetical protein